MKFLFGFSYYSSPGRDVKAWVDGRLGRIRNAGIYVDSFVLTLNAPGPPLYWPELDLLWRRGDKQLLRMHERLAENLENYDVFVNWNGINVHPDFVRQLHTFNIYGCFDDPEASELLSKPTAWAYDLALVGNIAELDKYKRWGVKHVQHWPLGFIADDYDPSLTREEILKGQRDVDIALLCERETSYRAERLERFIQAFPQTVCYGKGWPRGYLPEEEKVHLYQRTKIGPNFHNSTGPVNFRTFVLPANGVMQVCDNKSHLGKLFELGKEVVGFDTPEEGIELCRYYLEHDTERREIAAAGWARAVQDYNEVEVFRIVERCARELMPSMCSKADHGAELYLRKHRRRTIPQRFLYALRLGLRKVLWRTKSVAKFLRKLVCNISFKLMDSV